MLATQLSEFVRLYNRESERLDRMSKLRDSDDSSASRGMSNADFDNLVEVLG